MTDEFIVRLGESKQDKLNKEFSMLHDETSFEIMRKVGSEGFAMYYTLNSYTRGNSGVMAFPKNDTLARKLNVNERTVRRWKSVLIQENILRVIPCHLDNGTQTSNVILLNAAYPEIPDDWFTYGAEGFVHSKGCLPKPKKSNSDIIMRKIRVKHGRTNLSGYQNMGGQNCPGIKMRADKTARERGTKLSASPSEIADGARADGTFFEGEPYVVEPYKKIDIYDAREENSFKNQLIQATITTRLDNHAQHLLYSLLI